MQEQLTQRQQQILQLIRDHLRDTGMPPTRADIAAHFGFRSPNAAESHLRALARKGAIEMVPGTSRGIRLTEDQAETGLPVIGRVAAGSPILAIEQIREHVNVPASLYHPSADYFLEVHGDSMIDAGILDGDLIAVHRCQEASNGEIVVARLDDEVTVKRFQRQRGLIQLIAENPAYAPIEIGPDGPSLSIEGKYVGLLRRN